MTTITSFGIMCEKEPEIVGKALELIGYEKPVIPMTEIYESNRFLIKVVNGDPEYDLESKIYDRVFDGSRYYIEEPRTLISLDPNLQDKATSDGDPLLSDLRNETLRIKHELHSRGFNVHGYELSQGVDDIGEDDRMTTIQ